MKPINYSLFQLRGDLFGGLTAGVVALPLALAFGVASGAGAIAGLYGAIALGFFAALLGGTPSQVSGPTGPMTVITAAAVAGFPGDLQAVFTVVLIAGALQIVLGMIKAGTFVRYIPYPVISGFMSGIGVIIILLQLHPLFGSGSVGSPLVALIELPRAIGAANGYSLLLAGLTMLIVFLTPCAHFQGSALAADRAAQHESAVGHPVIPGADDRRYSVGAAGIGSSNVRTG